MFFSDCTTHNTVAVHSFLKVVIDYLKGMHEKLKKLFILVMVLRVSIRIIKISSILLSTKMILSWTENGIFSPQATEKVRVMGSEELLKDWLEELICKAKPTSRLHFHYLIGVNITFKISNVFSCHQKIYP